MISYCIAAYRPNYVRLLLADLVAKTSVPFEILLWLNVADSALDTDIETAINKGVPLRVIGRTPENIGMVAFSSLFRSARFPLITQIDDDVVFISRGIAERASRLFQRFPAVSQLVADVWQDEYTTGARPPMDRYEPFEASEGCIAARLTAGSLSTTGRFCLSSLTCHSSHTSHLVRCCISGSLNTGNAGCSTSG
jgi:hypothetical protein